jgi:hypothetical protein
VTDIIVNENKCTVYSNKSYTLIINGKSFDVKIGENIMPSLFSASWKLKKFDVEQTYTKIEIAVEKNQKDDALQAYAEMQQIFQSVPWSIASWFEKISAQSYQKKLLGKAQKLLLKNGWL